jgi:hypothetical protein
MTPRTSDRRPCTQHDELALNLPAPAGLGTGGRVAAVVGSRCRGDIAAYLLLGYPLGEEMPSAKGAAHPDSAGPLLKLAAPALFVSSAYDSSAPVAQLQVCTLLRPCCALLHGCRGCLFCSCSLPGQLGCQYVQQPQAPARSSNCCCACPSCPATCLPPAEGAVSPVKQSVAAHVP